MRGSSVVRDRFPTAELGLDMMVTRYVLLDLSWRSVDAGSFERAPANCKVFYLFSKFVFRTGSAKFQGGPSDTNSKVSWPDYEVLAADSP